MTLLESLEGAFKDNVAVPYDRSTKPLVDAMNRINNDIKKIAKAFDKHYHSTLSSDLRTGKRVLPLSHPTLLEAAEAAVEKWRKVDFNDGDMVILSAAIEREKGK